MLFTTTNFLYAQQFELSQEIEAPSKLRRTNPRFPGFNEDQFAQMAGDQAIYGGFGVAYIFEKNESGQWELTAELTGSDVISGDGFGAKASISEDRAIVKSNTKAYIFETKDGEWQEVAKISVSDKEDSGYSSSVVSAVGISGDYALIGDQNDDGPNGDIPEAGVVYVYERTDDGSWEMKQELYASDASLDNFFGRRISMDGNRAVIGMNARTSFYRTKYAGYIFEKDETGNWHETAVLEPYGAYEDNYEPRQAISGDYVAFGDVGYEFDGRQPGEVFIYEYTAEGWELADHFNAPDKEKFDDFGIHLALDNNNLLIQTSGRGSSGGRGTYYYSRSADGQWEHNQILRNHYLLDISGDDAIAVGPEGSTVYFFKRSEESPITVTGFSLVDADNNVPLQVINEGNEINLQQYPAENFNIHIIPREHQYIRSVAVELKLNNSLYIDRKENVSPYAAFGDRRGDYRNWQPERGWYTLKADVHNSSFGRGEMLSSRQIRFHIIDEPVVEQPAVAARSEGAGLSVYPNPAVSQVHAKVASAAEDQPYQLSVFNAFGQKVFQKSGKGSFDEMIDLNRQEPGLYMVVIESQGQREVKRLLVRK